MVPIPSRVLRVLALALAIVAPALAHAKLFEALIDSAYTFEHGGRSYTVLLVQPDVYDYERATEKEQTRILADRVKEWIGDQYAERYTQEDPEQMRKMVMADDFVDGTSSWMVVVEDGDLSKIRGTMRFAYSTEDKPALPLSRYLGVELPPEPIRYAPYPVSVELWKDAVDLGFVDTYEYETVSALSGRKKKKTIRKQRLHGSTVEIKNFIVSKEAEQDLVPLLFYLSEKTSISYYNSNQVWMRDLPSVPELKDVDPKLLSGAWGPRSDMLHPSRYVLYAKPPLDVYYRALGFQRHSVQPKSGNSTIFTMDRETYVGTIGEKFRRRPGLELLKGGKLDWLPMAHVWQGEIKGIPSWKVIDCKLKLQKAR